MLTAAPGAQFADRVQVRATYRGKGLADTAVTATMITDAETAGRERQGTALQGRGRQGRTHPRPDHRRRRALELPEIYADGVEGTYKLRLTTANGVTLVIELKVEAAPAA